MHALITRYRVALPLHPESRTMPMVWYVPPLSPVVDALTATGHDGEDPANLFGAIDSLRIPLGYLAELFTAGDPAPVEAALCRLAAMRSHMRRINLGEERDPAIVAAVGMDQDGIEAMYRLLALAKYEERYVIPTSYTTGSGGDTPMDSCSLDGDGLPGMMPYDPSHADAFHTPPAPEPAGTASGLAGRINLLNWNGRGRPTGLFPRRNGDTR
ncbi:Respiratory nitrate reductase 2 beta chain [Streptomyces antimycoticus]